MSASGWVQRVTGRRRPAPEPDLPEPLELAPRADDPAPMEPIGVSLMRTPPASEGTAPCGERVGGHLLLEDGTCWYGCEVAS